MHPGGNVTEENWGILVSSLCLMMNAPIFMCNIFEGICFGIRKIPLRVRGIQFQIVRRFLPFYILNCTWLSGTHGWLNALQKPRAKGEKNTSLQI